MCNPKMTQYCKHGGLRNELCEEANGDGFDIDADQNRMEIDLGGDMSERGAEDSFNALNQFGVSETLIGLFQSLREAPGLSGYKYRTEDISRLERAVVFRNYGKACLELSYLLTAILQLPIAQRHHSPLLQHLWIEQNITPVRVRSAFAEADGEVVSLTEEGIQQQIGADRFVISPTRVGYLAALMELIAYINPAVIAEAEHQLIKPAVKSIQSFSSRLQKWIYDYLDEHLMPAQLRRRFRFLMDWCLANKPEHQSVETFTSDQVVFQFWQQVSELDENLGFRRFRSVGDDFIALLKALELGRSRSEANHAATIGLDVEAGEWHPDQLEQLYEELGLELADVGFLAKAPKFFASSTWVEVSQRLMDAGQFSARLPLTIMRMDVLGGLQAKLIQADKDKNHERFRFYMDSIPEQDYSAYLDGLEQYTSAIQDARMLGLGLFLQLNSPEALALLAEILPTDVLQAMQQCMQDAKSDQLLEKIVEIKLQVPELNRVCQQATKLLKKTNRAGFSVLPQQDELFDYSYALDVIAQCNRLRNGHVCALHSKLEHHDTVTFTEDLETFRRILRKLYGEQL
ncbi:MAG: hypothetical protein GY938_18360 [Ketobacter sp.]|nr:hypothetical protein [Ketobacter sp.]